MWEAWEAEYGGDVVHSGHTYNLYLYKRGQAYYMVCVLVLSINSLRLDNIYASAK